MAKPRIIQWCTGSMGRITLRQLIDRSDIDLVGVYVTSDKKNGLDAGQIARRPDTGIIATNDIDEILKLEADAVIHTSLLTAPYETQNGNVIKLLESGKNILSPNGFFEPEQHGETYAGALREAALKGGVTLAGIGLNPGFIGERLALLLSGMSSDVTAIRTSEVVNVSDVPSADLIKETVGLGVDPKAYDLTKGSIAKMYNLYWAETMGYMARKLGTSIMSFTPQHEVILAPADIPIKVMTIKQGQVAAINWKWLGQLQNGIEVRLSILWTSSHDLHGETESAHWRVEIDGRPNVRADVEIFDADPAVPRGKPLMESMAALFLNAVPHVIDAPAGFFDLPAVMPNYTPAP